MKLPETVGECHELITRLMEENACLRRSGAEFGHLAERLNVQLQEERRQGERRQMRRGGEDRRVEAAPPPEAVSR